MLFRSSDPIAAALVVAGLIGLAIGSELTVRGGSGLARTIGVPEPVIGLVLVAIGTSLPELVASVIAVRRGETDLALGNVVGSNLFNLLFVLGTTASIAPVVIPRGGLVDLGVSLAAALLLLPVVLTGRRISRAEGAVLLVGWSGYCGARLALG